MDHSPRAFAAAFAVLAALSIGSIAHPQTAAAAPAGIGVMQGPPVGAQLSPDEQTAIANKNAGRPYDRVAYNRAMQKIKQAEKYNGDRNKQKRGRK